MPICSIKAALATTIGTLGILSLPLSAHSAELIPGVWEFNLTRMEADDSGIHLKTSTVSTCIKSASPTNFDLIPASAKGARCQAPILDIRLPIFTANLFCEDGDYQWGYSIFMRREGDIYTGTLNYNAQERYGNDASAKVSARRIGDCKEGK